MRQKKSIFLTPVDDDEITKAINQLKSKGSTGTDGISNALIKENYKIFIKPLKHIINLIFESAIVPDHFKVSVVIPIYKTGNAKLTENYRPISLINNIAKIFEKCLKNRIYEFLEHNDLLNDKQFGFRKNKSTQSAILCLCDDILRNFDNGSKTLAIFLDLKKAFDTVPHKLLLDKLEKYGIRGKCWEIIFNYLSNRRQRTKIGETLSDEKTIQIGLPQGTVLAPILFLIYINDLLNLNINGKIISYADDTVVIFEGQNWNDIEKCANVEFGKVRRWLNQNLLTLNINKTKYMTFSPTNRGQPGYNLKVELHEPNCSVYDNQGTMFCNCDNPDELQSTVCMKYLGVLLDNNLKWKEHTAALAKKLKCTLPKFYDLRNIVSYKILEMVYNALVDSLLNYAIVAWGGTYPANLKTLEIVHKHILKILNKKNKYTPTSQLYNDVPQTPLLLKFCIACILHVHLTSPTSTQISHCHNTRALVDQQLTIPKISTTANHLYHLFIAPKLYNAIPKNIRNIKSRCLFYVECKKFVLKNRMTFLSFFG